MKRKIKIFLHHDHFVQALVDRPISMRGGLRGLLKNIGHLLFLIPYGAGLAVINFVLLPVHFYRAVKNVKNLPQHFNNISRKLELRRTILVFVMLAIISGGAVHGAAIIASGQSLKGRVLGASDEGLQYLKEAQSALEAEDVSRAEVNFSKALSQFQNSEQEIQSASTILKGILDVVPQKRDGDKLLEALQLMTEAALHGTKAFAITQNMKITPDGLSGDNPEQSIRDLQSLVEQSTANLLRASNLLSSVSINTIPESQQQSFLQVRDALSIMEGSMMALRDVFGLLADIALGEKNILLVLQNNNELRPTGGFIGTVGTARFSSGRIKNLDIRSVYDFDGQMHEWILPPSPLEAINDRWYLRDANWFADFKSASQRMIALYEKEGGETPDMVMAFTPELIIELLHRTGPLTLPRYGVTLTADNFVEAIQTSTSIAYDKDLNQPKQLLADFFPVLMQKLGTMENGLMPLLEVLHTSLYQKDILLYSGSGELQSRIESFNWGGRIAATDRDYFNVVRANLGGTKTDRFIASKLKRETEIKDKGEIINTVTYTLTNPLPDAAGLRNMSFVRFLVPEGSELIASGGFTENSPKTLPDQAYSSDLSVTDWNKNLRYDPVAKIYTGKEDGKMFFANWVETKGGESKTISLRYKLPFTVNALDRFSLIMQKQPGALPIEFEQSITFSGRSVIWKSADIGTMDDKSLTLSGKLTTDRYIGLVLETQ